LTARGVGLCAIVGAILCAAAPASAQKTAFVAAARQSVGEPGLLANPATETTVSSAVSAPGEYVVDVSVRAARRGETVAVFFPGHSERTLRASTKSPAHLSYRATLTDHDLAVRAFGASSPVHLGVTMKLVKAKEQPATPAPTPAPAPAPAPAPTAPVTPPLAPNPYTHLVWSDEFSGAAGAAPDPTNWSYDTPGASCGGGTLSTNVQSTANAQTDGNGHLDIVARSNGAGGYTSAQLDTAGLHSFQYGAIEASIELPPGEGLCPQFWMVGDSTQASPCSWPGCGEIDILEAPAFGPISSTAVFTLHGPMTNGGANGNQQWESYVQNFAGMTTGFHTYGVIWSPGTITWTIDGVAYAIANAASLAAGSTWAYDNRTFHLILDMAVGGWPGAPASAATFPATMQVDWVHVYN
jgi:beta-glucanase (GH16 family)